MREEIKEFFEEIGYFEQMKEDTVDKVIGSIQVLLDEGIPLKEILEGAYSELGGKK